MHGLGSNVKRDELVSAQVQTIGTCVGATTARLRGAGIWIGRRRARGERGDGDCRGRRLQGFRTATGDTYHEYTKDTAEQSQRTSIALSRLSIAAWADVTLRTWHCVTMCPEQSQRCVSTHARSRRAPWHKTAPMRNRKHLAIAVNAKAGVGYLLMWDPAVCTVASLCLLIARSCSCSFGAGGEALTLHEAALGEFWYAWLS
jgi:hypothetical protein